jgi:tetratricopeptide (TPR) repeat protein
MNVRNRMADVVKLRCNSCQDFLKMIIADGWQQVIYNKAKNEVASNGRYKDKYISAYEKMREIGIDNYSVDDMDVTFISEIVHGCRSIAPTDERTRKSIEQLTEDRNLTNHSNENEEDEELYLRGLLALCNLKRFIRTIDKFETTITDDKRSEYRSYYAKKIEELKDILDEERIRIIQKRKDIERDIRRVLDCTDEKQRLKVWCELEKLYMDRYWKLENDYERFNEFNVAASDAGIVEAHGMAINYFFLINKDYVEGERRLYMLYESYDLLPAYESKSIIDSINFYLAQKNELTDGMNNLIKHIIDQGYPIEKNENGFFIWSKKVVQNP